MEEALGTYFGNYQVIFVLFYGLLFYSMGVSVLLYSQHYSRLTLAKSLPWLGGFGILIGFYAWGFFIVPVQIDILGLEFFPVFMLIQEIFQALALISLFQFGVELLGPYRDNKRWVRMVPTFVFFAWLIGPYIIGFSVIPNVGRWSFFVSACTRYFICIPGVIVAVAGLIQQQRRQIKPLKIPFIDTMVRIAAGSLAAYGLFSGVVVPKSFFFPASFLNEEWFFDFFHIPSYVLTALAGFLLLIAILRTLVIYNVETDNTIRLMEETQLVANERERVARDLHDGVLQQVYASGLLAQSLKKHVPADQKQEVDRLILTINQAIEQLRGFLPQVQPEVKFLDLVGAIMPKIEEARSYIHVNTHWDAETLPSLTVEQTRHIAALLSEAISNAIRHAQSDKIDIELNYHSPHLILEVRDYGTGISSSADQGHGLKNMKDRAKLLGAKLLIESEITAGTLVKLDMIVEENEYVH